MEYFKHYYGELVKFNGNIRRSENNIAVHLDNTENKESLITDVMRDAISLSLCDEILITASNVSAHAITLNPHIKYSYLDKHISYR